MEIIRKIKEHGFKGTVKVIMGKRNIIFNKMLYYICWLIPIDEKLICFESEGDLSDNTFALYDYMKKNNYFSKYKAVWFVDNVDIAKEKKDSFPNTCFVIKNGAMQISFNRARYLASCKWFIFDHCDLFEDLAIRKNHKSINLWHGCGFKQGKNSKINHQGVVINTGDFFNKTTALGCGYNYEQIFNLGYPRNDYFFCEDANKILELKKLIFKNSYEKLFLWMPTFRRSYSAALDESYFESKTGLPIVYDVNGLEKLDLYLKSVKSLCVFKVHHLQLELPVFKQKFENIVMMNDEDLAHYNIQLYQVMPIFDCLITDYSSIYNDFMLLNKPIIFTVDDYEKYRDSRGFWLKDSIKYFAGECVKTYSELIAAMTDVCEGIDKYAQKRHELLPLFHTYTDGLSSRRILEKFDIKNN